MANRGSKQLLSCAKFLLYHYFCVIKTKEMIAIEYKQFFNYLVYENGDVYSNYTNKFLKGETTKFGYKQYTLSIGNGKKIRIKAHRLVGLLFLPIEPGKENELVINHKDGNKLNNHYSNLEWVTIKENNEHARVTGLNDISKSNSKRWKNKEWAENMSKKLSQIALMTECNKGKNNRRFRYEIFDKNNNEYNRIELAEFLGISQSYTDTLIRKLAKNQPINNKKALEYGIYVIDIKEKS